MTEPAAASAKEPNGDPAQRSAWTGADRPSPAHRASPVSPRGTGPDGPASPSSADKPTRPNIPGWANWLIFGILLVWNLLIFLPVGSQAVDLPYSDFVAQVRQGNVHEVEFSGQKITGQFNSAVTWPPAADAPAASGQATETASITSSSFTTVMPPTNDAELLPLLQARKVTVTAKDTTSSPGILSTLLVSLLPTVLLIGLFYFSGRSMMKNGQNVLGFGGSRAKRYDPERPSVTFADVAGEDEAKVELTEIVDFLKAPDRYRKLGARLPRGVLLVGPPGVGKTLMARAVAGEAHVAFFSISGSEFVEMFVGVGASRVRDLFKQAKAAAPAIVFVDELDAVGRSRSTGAMGSNDEREQTLNQLLVEMDGFDANTSVMVIAATNRPDVLDQAILRPGRFDRQVTLGYPDRAGREAILRIHSRGLPLAPDVDLGAIARSTPGFSGADLANLANEAALMAARTGGAVVTPADFSEALDKITLGTKQASLADVEERRTVAYHEGGHALVALLTPGSDPVHKITIVPRGQALGVTEQRPEEDRRNYSRVYLRGRLAVMLGGRAAEETVFGEPTTGAESDLKGATNLARRMVGMWGMSEELGPVSYGLGETHQYLGMPVSDGRDYADSTASRIDAAVTLLLEEARSTANGLLRAHRASLDAVAAELVEREVMDGTRLAEILAETRGSAIAQPEAAASIAA
jgi:cell division protease FtsH